MAYKDWQLDKFHKRLAQKLLAKPGVYETVLDQARFSWDFTNKIDTATPNIMFGFSLLNQDYYQREEEWIRLFESIKQLREVDILHNAFKFYTTWIEDELAFDLHTMGYEMVDKFCELPSLFEQMRADENHVVIEITYSKDVLIRDKT